jgi:hypothetical protein
MTSTPGQRLLSALRRLAGDAPLTHRFKPAEWVAITKELGFTDAQKNEAVTFLRTAGLIQFTPESTQIIALTSDGIAKGNELLLHQQNRDVRDPMPKTLDAIRADLNYWEEHLNDGDPGSNWWEQVQARIVGLRHRENRFLTPVSITNNAIGPNSRNNINSLDRSTNRVLQDTRPKWHRGAHNASQLDTERRDHRSLPSQAPRGRCPWFATKQPQPKTERAKQQTTSW